jgi:hypothetical protein
MSQPVVFATLAGAFLVDVVFLVGIANELGSE